MATDGRYELLGDLTAVLSIAVLAVGITIALLVGSISVPDDGAATPGRSTPVATD